MVSTFTTLIDQLTSTTDENELNLKFMELTALMNSPQKPSKESFINWATQQNDIQITNLMSLCLDTYVPYFDIVNLVNRLIKFPRTSARSLFMQD